METDNKTLRDQKEKLLSKQQSWRGGESVLLNVGLSLNGFWVAVVHFKVA